MPYFKDIKKTQDELLINNPEEYNHSMRNIAKLFLNSLTGKVIEKPHPEQTEFYRSAYQAHSAAKRMKEETIAVNFYNKWYTLTGEKKNTGYRPCHLGVLVYSYARKHMYENIYSKIPLADQYQTDTDSLFATKESIDEHREWAPHLYGTEFGQLGSEGVFKEFYAIRPKFYCAVGNDKQSSKYRLKGIQSKAVIVNIGGDKPELTFNEARDIVENATDDQRFCS